MIRTSRRLTLFIAALYLFFALSGNAQINSGHENQISLKSHEIELALDPSSGYSIVGLRDPKTGTDFAATGARPGLYRIVMSRSDGSSYEITSKSAKCVRSSAPDRITLSFDHPEQGLRVIGTVRLDAAQKLGWTLRIENHGNDGVRSVFYPQWIAPPRLSQSALENRILYPSMDGQEFVDPAKHFTPGQTVSSGYPGLAAVQMIAYHDDSAGLLEMTRDGNGENKHFRIVRRSDGFDLSIEHNPGETPGTNIDLPYETSMQVFHGDWHEAADIYKTWAVQQKWAARKIRERGTPRWLTSGYPIVTYQMRGDPYSAEWSMYFPPSARLLNPDFYPTKIPAIAKSYENFFQSKVISNPFGWEHNGPWIAGDYFPPVLGEETWRDIAAKLHAEDSPLFLLLSGLRWGVRMDDLGYNTREQFLRDVAPKAAAYDPQGKPIEDNAPWGDSIQLCVGTNFGRESTAVAFLGCIRRGASLVQYDQSAGGTAPVCYSHVHPHPPGYGRWMVQGTESLFTEVRAKGKRINPEFALSVEEPCEYFIPYWDLYMGRPYEFFGTGSDPSSWRTSVPLFLYNYHEYLLGYGGSNEIDVTHPYAEAIKVARKFTNGTLLEIDPGKPAFRLDTQPSPTDELRLARSCSLAQRTYANDYLIFGKMLRDPRIPDRKTQTLRAWHDPRDRHPDSELPTVQVPLVLESTWESSNKVAYVFANWQTSAQEVVFEPQRYDQNGAGFKLTVYDDSGTRVLRRDPSLPREIRLRIPALAATMVEQSAE